MYLQFDALLLNLLGFYLKDIFNNKRELKQNNIYYQIHYTGIMNEIMMNDNLY